MSNNPKITRVTGPLVEADGMSGVKMHEVVYVGAERLIGEVIKLMGDKASIQVYEETSGLMPGARVEPSGKPLMVELGPGLLSSIYDGIQRPLDLISSIEGDFISAGISVNALDRKKKWRFNPVLKEGDELTAGGIIGTVQESKTIEHKILAPPTISGKVKTILEGDFTVDETVCILEDKTELTLMHEWPVKTPRPVKSKYDPSEPMMTGQRVIDGFFPIAKGGTATIPGPFGAGKTVTQHQLAKWSDADVIVYVGCGERGNEMAQVLLEFPELEDPKHGQPLMQRTILIANTSNMPVAAREASVYTGVTIAEYYRDQGYNTALMADSTSRWAEALREISSRLEEMPGEEGYPAYLGSRLAQFYERSGKVKALAGVEGSTTIIGAVSPPGGDFSEPVTQNTLRIARVFWALDARLADRRHFPAIDWLKSYSLYKGSLDSWFNENVGEDYSLQARQAQGILQRENELMEIVQLVGADALPPSDRLLMETARMIREDFLQQNSFHEVDTYCSLEKLYWMMKIILEFDRQAMLALEEGARIEDVTSNPLAGEIAKMKYVVEEDFKPVREKLYSKIQECFK
ncbi:MAG TPA: V-type ATP synthase subunit A [Candidatus Altiarchaeales archaeon]|nr:V-type ATP synthase subunit A [Candidatus Altiarchaeales archaeon]